MKPMLVFGPDDRDAYTLRRVAELRLTVALECPNCRRVLQLDILDLIGRFGTSETVGAVRRRARCSLCKHKGAAALLRFPGIRGDKAWSPRPPLGR